MKKLLHILLFCGILSGVYAQSNNNCGNLSTEIETTEEALPLCEGISTSELSRSTESNLPNTEFFIVNVDQPADEGQGGAIIGISDTDVFNPQEFELTYNQRFAVRPFSVDINEFRNLINFIRNNNDTSSGDPCCLVAESITKDFCDNLFNNYGIYDGNDVNTLSDVWSILKVSTGDTGSTFSPEGFISHIGYLKLLIDALPESCRYNSQYCYALGEGEQLFRILEAPEIVEVMTDTPHEITINSIISDGLLQYSIDGEEWQEDNVIRDTPSEGTAYVREVASECSEAMYFSNPNLNVELKEFKSSAEITTNLLYWVTETEIDNAGFSIERSSDGQNFTKIGWIDGAGTSQAPIPYTFRDGSPLTGTSYYKLAMEDLNGRVEHSDIVTVQRKDGTGFSILSIGPNPSANIINVSILNEQLGPVEYMVYDVMGRKVRHGTRELVIGINNFPIDATVMGTGMYIFTAFKDDYVVSAYKFVMH